MTATQKNIVVSQLRSFPTFSESGHLNNGSRKKEISVAKYGQKYRGREGYLFGFWSYAFASAFGKEAFQARVRRIIFLLLFCARWTPLGIYYGVKVAKRLLLEIQDFRSEPWNGFRGSNGQSNELVTLWDWKYLPLLHSLTYLLLVVLALLTRLWITIIFQLRTRKKRVSA